jgi:hypothetical protein
MNQIQRANGLVLTGWQMPTYWHSRCEDNVVLI